MEKFAKIVEREDGFYLLSKDGIKTLGGPYKNRAKAVERERQIWYFKKHGEFTAFSDYFAIKLAKYRALGIPDKKRFREMPVSENAVWLANIQEHHARVRGKHFDLRLNDPNSLHAYSWAISKLPEPGEKVPAIEQPTHSKKYMG